MENYIALVLSRKFSTVEGKKAFLALFALRFPGFAEHLKKDSSSLCIPDLRIEFELGSYEISDEEITATLDGDTYYSLRELSQGCDLHLLDYGRDTDSPDLEIEANDGKITKYESYEWAEHDVSKFNLQSGKENKDASPCFQEAG